MAQQIPFSIVEKIIVKLASVSFQQVVSIYHADRELKKLEETLSSIKAVLLDAEKRQEESEAVRNWTKRLKRVLNQADDLLDDVHTQALKLMANPGKVCKFFSTPKRIFSRHQIASRIKNIRVRLDDIAKDMSGFNFTPTFITKSKHRETQSFVMESEIIGREKSKDELKKLLLQSDNSYEKVSLVAIVGMGGLGKTTLAQLLYNDAEVVKFFGKMMWVCVSDVFYVRRIAKRILECFTNQDTGNLSLNELGNKLRTHMSGTKYLLVLDDVWNENYGKWKKLRDFIMVGAPGSKILVTTRSKIVASTMGIKTPYTLGILTEEQSRDLFRKTAFQGIEGDSLIQEKEKIGDEIAKKCKGVPLAITTIAGMLRSKSEIHEWSRILHDEIRKLPQQDEDVMPVLRLSYNHLPVELRQCFAYCAIYEKDHMIVKEELIQLWMAQGYLEVSNEKQCVEDIGEEYVLSLVRRSFFQDIKKDKFGEIVSFKMHDLIHDLALSIAGSDCSVYQKSNKISAETLHLSCQLDNICWDDFLFAKELRTFLSISESKVQCNSISAFGSLRALTIGNLISWTRYKYMDSLPEAIGRLTHLRYLNLYRQKGIKSLPNSICNLVNLQTLRLDVCDSLKELPQGITKLVNLRCLATRGCSMLCMPSGIGKLTSLTSLPRFIVGNDSKSLKLKELKGLNNLRGDLMVEVPSLVPDDSIASESSEANLKEKKCLRSLTIYWHKSSESSEANQVNHVERNFDLQLEMLENLEPHNGLKGLTICCYSGFRLSSWLLYLTNLTRLKLKSLNRCKEIPPFNGLPLLQKISIKNSPALEYIYYDIGSSMMFFPSLTKLSVVECPNLKEWRPMQQQIQEHMGIKCENQIETRMLPPTFPHLSELKIFEAPKLFNMPLFPHVLELEFVACSIKPLMQTVMCLTEISISDTAANTLELEVKPSSTLRPYVPLSKLKSLTISKVIKDEEFQLAKDWMNNLQSLEHLKIDDEWEGLWEALGNITTLLELDVNDSYLESLPDSILNLVNLQKLTIAGFPNLKTLPEWIGSLTSLCELTVVHCLKLASLPKTRPQVLTRRYT